MKNYIKNILKSNYTRESISYPILSYLIERYACIKYRFNFMEEFKLLVKTKQIKESMKGKNAFVFGNGPSFDKLDYNKVKNYQKQGFKIICVNSFISAFEKHGIIPDFYVLSDPGYFVHNNISEALKDRVMKDIHFIEKYKIPLFIPLQYAKQIDIDVETYCFNDCEILWKNRNVNNILKPRSYLSMTAYKALAIAGFLGFNTIYISGFDNDYIQTTSVDIDNNIYFDDRHFDSNEKKKVREYDKKIVPNMAHLLYSHSFLFSDLYKFDDNIINLDPDSLVDAFGKRHKLNIYENG